MATPAEEAQKPDRSHLRKGPKPLATCIHCRQRKIKCDRADPCAHCVHAGKSCVRAPPSHMPRGRQGGRRKVDSELLQRIAKLENMVKDLESTSSPSAPPPAQQQQQQQQPLPDVQQMPTVTHSDSSEWSSSTSNRITPTTSIASVPSGGVPLTKSVSPPATSSPGPTRKASMSPNAYLDRYMASSMWQTLGDEIAGMKEILAASSDSEDDESEPTNDANSMSPANSASPGITLMGRDVTAIKDIRLQHPSLPEIRIMWEYFIIRVDPMVKIFHTPTLCAYLHGETDELPGSPGLQGLEALRFAIYYATVTSMSEAECINQLGDDRQSLINRHRSSFEVALNKADILHTEDLSALQALMLYITTLRSNDRSRSAWTLAALAVRIGIGLGIHNEHTLSTRSPFDQEMRRRLWWFICCIDAHAASDRGTDRMLSETSFDAKLSPNINDSDISPESTVVPPSRNEFTDMTFSLICQTMFGAFTGLNTRTEGSKYAVVTNQVTPEGPWAKRRAVVISSRRQVEDQYLRFCKQDVPLQRMAMMVADVITANMWLFIYRPLYRVPGLSFATEVPYPGILHLAVEVMDKHRQIMTDPSVARYLWYSNQHVVWHPLAVALSELCVQPEGATVERAWQVIPTTVDHVMRNCADGVRGRLWRPIRKLLSRAQEVRQQHLEFTTNVTQPLAAMQWQTTQAQLRAGNTTPDKCAPPSTKPTSFAGADAMAALNPMNASHPLYPQPAFATPQAPTPQIPLPQISSIPEQDVMAIDWDPWLVGTFNGSAGPEMQVPPADQAGWDNWETFVSDFQADNDLMNAMGMPAG